MKLRRRIIPVVIAVAFGLAAFSPLVTDWPDDGRANKWTLLTLAVMFAFKTVLFAWMRHRMVDRSRILTRFGAALVDFFSAVVLCDLAIVVFFGVAYWYANPKATKSPFWLRLCDRGALIAGAAFVISTGAAVALEMQRAGLHLSVHEEAVKEG